MKRFLALAWRKSADEKIPLYSKNSGIYNGTISKPPQLPPEKTEKEKMAGGKVVDLDDPCPQHKPMSLLRKLAMFLSLNIIALYFVAFAWLIPCRISDCPLGQEWMVDLDNIGICTNLEISALPSSELLLFGYVGGNEASQGVAALLSSTGSTKWNSSLLYSPVYCYCNVVDINRDGVLDCLILGEQHLLALNASNGYVFWIQEFWTISSLVVTTSCCDDDSQWIVLVEDQGRRKGHFRDQQQNNRINMVIMDSRNATVVKYLPLRCDSFPKQLVSWKSETNATQIAFQCSYKGKTEVRIIAEEELCNLVFGGGDPEMTGSSLPFSFGSSTAVDDVFLLPVSHVGLLVCWSTMVAMATDARNTPRLLWQTASGSIRSAIKFALGGYFTSRNSTEIAVVVNEDSSSSVKVVDVVDGQEVSSIDIGAGAVLSSRSVPGMMENNDHLLIIKEGRVSPSSNGTASDVIDSTTESERFANTTNISRQLKTYLLLTFGKEMNVTELLTEDRRTYVAVKSGDCTTAFLATRISNHTTRISSRNLRDHSSRSSCSCR